MIQILWAVLVLAGLGVVFGIALAIAAVVFYVKEDTRIDDVTKMLPNYNCGSCGYAGCKQMAEAVVTGKENKLSKCKPGKPETNFNKIIAYFDEHPNEDGSKVNVQI